MESGPLQLSSRKMGESIRKNIVLNDSDSDEDIPLAKKMKILMEEKKDIDFAQQGSKAEVRASIGKIPKAKPQKGPVSETSSAKSSNSKESKTSKVSEQAKSSKAAKAANMPKLAKEPKTEKVEKKETKQSPSTKSTAEEDDDEDVPLTKMINLMKKEKSSIASAKPKKKSRELERLKDKKPNGPNEGDEEEEDEEYKWWENPTWDDTVKWETLEHSGIYFPPPYIPHGVKMLYNGKEIILEPEAEEVAGFFAALVDTEHAQNPIFVKNFFEDFRSVLEEIKSPAANVIQEFHRCDFRPMAKHFEILKEARKAMTKEEKAKIKEEKMEMDERYGWCILDGRREKVGNFRIEPPGLFRGRGAHPKAGKLKVRVRPEDITINIGKGAKIPLPPPGRRWKDVVNNNTVTWLATWTENVNGQIKYVQLGATSSLKGKSDYKKFETARRLKHHISSIRAKNAEELRSKEMAVRQRATALWLIDHLAIRAGNEKGDDEADTVGCCSLRCEHVTLNMETSEVTFDFLGKDSIRYLNTVKVDPIIVKNLSIFMRPPKTTTDMIFDRLDTTLLNAYLTSLMPGLTAKVFRTFNASFTMQRELDKTEDSPDASVTEKLLGYNRANREVAILCNHQRAVPKSHDQSMEKLKEKIMHLKYSRLQVKRHMRSLVEKKLYSQYGIGEDESDIDEETEKRIEEEIQVIELDKHRKKMEKDGKALEDDDFKPPKPSTGNLSNNVDVLQKRLDSIAQRIQAARHSAIDREENKTTALGTSKINYIDPRITATWCQIHQVPIEKMFTKTLRDKFKWAMDVPKEWRF